MNTLQQSSHLTRTVKGHKIQNALLTDEHCILPPECENGNIEYKLKLIDPSPSRLEHLVTQMKWRLQEGDGEAIYEIGVEDNGGLKGLIKDEIDASLQTLHLMAQKIGASISIIREKIIEVNGSEILKVLEILVRKMIEDKPTVEVRITVLGDLESGKSSLLGVLTQGELDNGKGRARLNLFRHRHEIRSGRTSSINKEILGFDLNGTPITYNDCQTQEEICEKSSKIIIFIDSAGHPKYSKTTVFSLTAMHPDYALLVINGLTGIEAGTNFQHLSLALSLELPIAVVVNKIDLCSRSILESTLSSLKQFISSSFCKNKTPLIIEKDSDIITYFNSLFNVNVVPIFMISCVNGVGLGTLYKFIQLLDSSIDKTDRDKLMKRDTLFQIDETFHVQDVGIVVSGFLSSGLIHEGNILKVGPLDSGSFVDVFVSSLQRHKVSRRIVRPGESSTLALEMLPNNAKTCSLDKVIRKGMVLLSSTEQNVWSSVCFCFQAQIYLMSNSSEISSGYQTTVYMENVRQSVMLIAILAKKSINPNESATVIIQFGKHPEYIRRGYRLLLQQGRTKAVGHVTQIFPYNKSSS